MASPRWEALVDVLSRPKTKLSVKRDVLTLFNVIITTAPTIEERVQLRRVLNLVRTLFLSLSLSFFFNDALAY